MSEFPSFLRLNSIPLCVYVYVSHIFFIHSSVDGQLGCFHDVLAIISNDMAGGGGGDGGDGGGADIFST